MSLRNSTYPSTISDKYSASYACTLHRIPCTFGGLFLSRISFDTVLCKNLSLPSLVASPLRLLYKIEDGWIENKLRLSNNLVHLGFIWVNDTEVVNLYIKGTLSPKTLFCKCYRVFSLLYISACIRSVSFPCLSIIIMWGRHQILKYPILSSQDIKKWKYEMSVFLQYLLKRPGNRQCSLCQTSFLLK